MSVLERGKPGSVKALLTAVTDHVTGADIVRADRHSAELALQRAHLRAAQLRERFMALRNASKSMREHLDDYERKRAS
ncbi:MAG: hypothetical protein WBV39_02860 [Rudaea sp.]